MTDEITYDGELYKWSISPVYYYKDRHSPYFIAYGSVYNDKKHRFNDGDKIHTSLIKSIDVEKGILYTKYSVYKLMAGYHPSEEDE